MDSSQSHAEAEAKADLDERILRVERRLMAREERLRRGVVDLSSELRERFQPRKLLLPVGGGLLAVAALFALWRRPERAAPAAAPAAARPQLPWMQLLGLAWPLLPERWRERINPAAAGSLLTLGLPLIQALLRPRPAEPLATVAEVDLARLAGRWFLVGELPAAHADGPLRPPELGLLPREDGRFDLLQRRIDGSGTHGSEALVEPVPGSHGGRLRISEAPAALRWLPQAWTEHGVLHVDAAYEEALLGSVGRDRLWLLSRQPALAAERRQALAQIADDRGFAVEKLQFLA
jgi:lipocalin